MSLGRLANTETVSGLLVVLLGALGLVAVGDLDIGVARDMGPGYMPRLVGWLLVVAGLAMTAFGLSRDHPRLPEFYLRPTLAIAAATAAFGALVDRMGMVAAVVAMTVLASLASPITRHRETPLLAAGMAAAAVLVFIVGLKLAIPIWPRNW